MTKNQPSTDEQWTLHSLNIHGVFFERWCQYIIEHQDLWTVKTSQYPVEFPPHNGPLRGVESTLDIRAETQEGNIIVTLLIECKKNNPNFVDWIFFSNATKLLKPNVTCIENTINLKNNTWSTESKITTYGLEMTYANEVRETRGTYSQYKGKDKDKTKTSNFAVSDAAYQISLATQAISNEENKNLTVLRSKSLSSPYFKQFLIPVIITTANLYKCNFNPQDVEVNTGEIILEKAKLEPLKYLVYEYPLPKHLQFPPKDLALTIQENAFDLFIRKHIYVVQSKYLIDFLSLFRPNIEKKD